MRVKLSSRNRLTLPKALLSRYPGVEGFEVSEEEGRIVLTPIWGSSAEAVRAKVAGLGLTEQDVTEAVAWARR